MLPHPPVLRAVQTVVDKLKGAGHAVLPWEPYKHPYAVDLANRVYASDGGAVGQLIQFPSIQAINTLTAYLGHPFRT